MVGSDARDSSVDCRVGSAENELVDGQGCNRLCDWRDGGTLVVGELKLFQVSQPKKSWR